MMPSPITTTTLLLILPLFLSLSHAAQFNILNRCPYTVWAAAVPGGGTQLNPRDLWVLNVSPNAGGRIWARTGCNFNSSGRGSCQTGDCGGVLSCTAYGQSPNTLAEYSLMQSLDQDFYDISLVDGFNVPMDFRPTSNCRDLRCTGDVNGQCPRQLRAPGGCNNPCTVFKTDEYCCISISGSGKCAPTDFSRYFKGMCPDAYSYPRDDATSTFTCPSGSNYDVVFCP